MGTVVGTGVTGPVQYPGQYSTQASTVPKPVQYPCQYSTQASIDHASIDHVSIDRFWDIDEILRKTVNFHVFLTFSWNFKNILNILSIRHGQI